MIETHKHGNYHKLKLFIKSHVQLLKDHASKIAVKGSVNVVQQGMTTQEEYAEGPIDEYGTEPGGDEVCYVECDKDPE